MFNDYYDKKLNIVSHNLDILFNNYQTSQYIYIYIITSDLNTIQTYFIYEPSCILCDVQQKV